MNTKSSLLLFFLLIASATLPAQRTIPANDFEPVSGSLGPAKTIVKLDPLTRLPQGNIPFDRVFTLRVYFDAKVRAGHKSDDVTAFYLYDKRKNTTEIIRLNFYCINALEQTAIKAYDESDKNLSVYPNAIDVVIPALYPNRKYEIRYSTLPSKVKAHYLEVFRLFYFNKLKEGKQLQTDYKGVDATIPTADYVHQYYTSNGLKRIFDAADGDMAKAGTEIIQFLANNNQLHIDGGDEILDFFTASDDDRFLSKVSTHVYTVQSSAKHRIVADGGVIYAGWQKGFHVLTPYIGVNIAFRPLDTDIPFSTLLQEGRIKFWQRFTGNLGMTVSSLAKEGYRANLISNSNLMVGAGFKISHVINLNAGGLLYNNIDPNPAIAKKTVGVAPYAGISINLLIKDAFGEIAKVFSYAK